MTETPRQILHVRLHQRDETLYAQLLALFTQITPLVQALPPDAADLDVTGALVYFALDPAQLANVILLRSAALYGATVSIGAAGNRMLAAVAARQHPGTATTVGTSREEVEAFLRPQPTPTLHGIGPASATLLARYGLHTVGALADAPLPTLQRILGTRLGRTAHEQAHGIDTRPVIASAPARSRSAELSFARDELDGARQRRALLALADRLGAQLRTEHQLCTRLTLTVGYADATSSTKHASFPRPTARTADLADLAGRIHGGLGLQRARVRVLRLRATELVDADRAPRQLSLDPGDARIERAEHAADAVCARFGPGAVTRGAGLGLGSRSSRDRGSGWGSSPGVRADSAKPAAREQRDEAPDRDRSRAQDGG